LKNRIAISFVLVIFLFGVAESRAQVPELIKDSEFREVAQAAVDSLYNFNFDASEQLLDPWREQHPENPVWTLLEGMRFWWKVLSDLENTSHDEKFLEIMAKADYESARLLRKKSDHADALIVKAVSNGYISRLYANRGEWISSVNRSRRAISAYQYLLEVEPGLPDLKLGEGIKLYYSAYIPEAYPIVKTISWALPSGNKEKGLELIDVAAEHAIFARAEAIYFLGNIFYNYEKDYDKAAGYLEQLYNMYPRNNYFVRILVKSFYKIKAYDRTLNIIEASLDRWAEHDLPYGDILSEELLTYKGRILYRQGKTEEARMAFIEAFNTGKKSNGNSGDTFHIISAYYSGRINYELGDYRQARRYLEQVLKMEDEANYHERARELLDRIESNL